jgi:hypothetical protein
MPHYAVTIIQFVDAENEALAKAMVMERLTDLLNGADDPDATVNFACPDCGDLIELDDDREPIGCPNSLRHRSFR